MTENNSIKNILWSGIAREPSPISLSESIFDYNQICLISKYNGGMYLTDHKILVTAAVSTNSHAEATGQGNEYYFESANINGKSYGMSFYVRPAGMEIFLS
ncbi:MAG: hypothetical protein ACRCZ9_02300, partial [Fusobacteriaceae bacterium]